MGKTNSANVNNKQLKGNRKVDNYVIHFPQCQNININKNPYGIGIKATLYCFFNIVNNTFLKDKVYEVKLK